MGMELLLWTIDGEYALPTSRVEALAKIRWAAEGDEFDFERVGAVAFIFRFSDVQTLEKVRGAIRKLPPDRVVPSVLVVHRSADKKDIFKMSCPHCCQKLWVRDSHEGKRGRCSNCKRAFAIHSQVELLREHLALPPEIEVSIVFEGEDDNCHLVFDRLVKRVSPKTPAVEAAAQAILNETRIIELDEDDLDLGSGRT